MTGSSVGAAGHPPFRTEEGGTGRGLVRMQFERQLIWRLDVVPFGAGDVLWTAQRCSNE